MPEVWNTAGRFEIMLSTFLTERIQHYPNSNKSMYLRTLIKGTHRRSLCQITIIRVMQLNSIFILAFMLQVNAASFGQARITLSKNNAPLKEVFKEISRQTGFDFLYTNRVLSAGRRVSLHVKDAELKEVLGACMAGQPLNYTIVDKTVVIKLQPEAASHAPAPPALPPADVNGKVLDEAGNPIPGATVLVKGTSKGVVSAADGSFHLLVPENGVLVVSFMGFETKEIPVTGSGTVSVVLTPAKAGLDEVIITAMGIKKEKKALGYSVQEVKGADLTKAREPNPVSGLTGKVAGLVITPSPNLFGDPGIQLRGRSNVLIVVDGVPVSSDSWNLNADDIESYSVLKGANAAALYGSRGQNGAIVITTKRAKADKKGFKVEVNSSTQLQAGYNAIPKYQTEYGPGDDFEYAFKDGRGGGLNDADYNIWGPRFEGQLITQYNSPKDPVTGELTPIPWLARGKDNLTNYLRNGLLSTNNVAISTANDKGDLRISFSQVAQRGQVPNTKYGSSNVNFTGGVNVGDKLRIEGAINYSKQYTPNYPSLGYGPSSLIYLITVWGGVDYDINDLRNYWQPGKENVQQYNREYTIYNNPWLIANEALHSYNKDDVYGHLQMLYHLSSKLDFKVRTNVSTWNRRQSWRYPMSADFYEPYRRVGGYRELYDYFWENNTEGGFTYKDKIGGSFNFTGSVMANLRTVKVSSLSGTTKGGLITPGVYDLANTKEQNSPSNDFGKRQVGSLYGFLDMDWKSMVFLSLTGRYDRSSTMPLKNNTYFYPSASLSIMLSEMLRLPDYVSMLKLRGSYANVAGDLANTSSDYNIYKLLPFYSTSGTRWDNNVGITYTGTLYNPDILPSRVQTAEAGVAANFFNNRLGIDAAYYRNIEGPGVVNVTVSSASGVNTVQRNANTFIRKGAEITLTGTPVRKKDFNWDVMVNWSTNHRWLKEIDGIQQRIDMIKIGDRYDSYYITDFQRDDKGNILVGNDGLPLYNPFQTKIGYEDNKFMLGMNNSFRYKNFGLSVQVDGRFGGLISNYVDYYQWKSGTAPASASEYRFLDWTNRNNPDWNGSVMTKGQKVVSGKLNADRDGNIISDDRKYAPNDVPVLWRDWATDYYIADRNLVHDATFVKLREVVLSYNFPSALLQRTKFFSTASISLVGRNLLYFTSKHNKNMELDQYTSDNAGFQTPAVKSYGVNINLSF